MHKLLAAACVFLLVFGLCRNTEPFPAVQSSRETVLLLGLIPEQQIFHQVTRYTPLADYLSKKTGLKIKLKVLSRYGNIIDNFLAAGMDGAFFGSFTYAIAHAKLGVEVLARPENPDGLSTYHGIIFVRKDSGIRTIKEMKGKRFVFVDKATTAGYLIALHYFKENGVSDYKSYFRETYFSGTHMDAIHDVLNRKADIGAAKNTVFDRAVRENPEVAKELVILSKSPEVPENALAVRKDLSEPIMKRLKEVLITMHNDPEGIIILKNFGARRFVETTDRDYVTVVSYAKTIGLDLSTYDYLNE